MRKHLNKLGHITAYQLVVLVSLVITYQSALQWIHPNETHLLESLNNLDLMTSLKSGFFSLVFCYSDVVFQWISNIERFILDLILWFRVYSIFENDFHFRLCLPCTTSHDLSWVITGCKLRIWTIHMYDFRRCRKNITNKISNLPSLFSKSKTPQLLSMSSVFCFVHTFKNF